MNRRNAIKIIAAAPIVGLVMPSDSLAAAGRPSTFDPNNLGTLVEHVVTESPSLPLKNMQLFFSPADKAVTCAINGALFNGKAKVHHGDDFKDVHFIDGKVIDAAWMFDEATASTITGISFDWNEFELNWNLRPIRDDGQMLPASIHAEEMRSTFASEF